MHVKMEQFYKRSDCVLNLRDGEVCVYLGTVARRNPSTGQSRQYAHLASLRGHNRYVSFDHVRRVARANVRGHLVVLDGGQKDGLDIGDRVRDTLNGVTGTLSERYERYQLTGQTITYVTVKTDDGGIYRSLYRYLRPVTPSTVQCPTRRIFQVIPGGKTVPRRKVQA